MKFKFENKYIQLGFTLFITALSIMLVYFLFFRIDSIKSGIATLNKILAPVTYGLIIAYIITPLLNTIERKLVLPFLNKFKEKRQLKNLNKKARACSILITFVIIILAFYLFFSSVVPEVYTSVQSIVSQYSTYTNNLVNFLNKTLDNNKDFADMLSNLIYDYSDQTDDLLNDVVMPAVQSMLMPNLSDFISGFSASLSKVFTFLYNIIIGLIIAIYVLASKEKFAKSCVKVTYAFLETPNANAFLSAVRFTHKTFIGFLSGKVVDSLIIGILCYFILLIMKMPYSALVSIIVGVTNIIPFFGPFIGAVPCTLLILLVDPHKALYFVIFVIILQQLDGNLIGPIILSQSTGLTSFWIIVSITLFGGLFGFIGMIIGVPVTAVILAFFNKLTNMLLKKKNLPTNEEEYFKISEITETGEIKPIEEKEKISEEKNIKLNKIKDFFLALIKKIKKVFTKMKKK